MAEFARGYIVHVAFTQIGQIGILPSSSLRNELVTKPRNFSP